SRGSNRDHNQAGNLNRVVDDDLLLEPVLPAFKDDFVHVLSRIEYFRLFVLKGLENDVVRLRNPDLAFLSDDFEIAGQMPQVTRGIEERLANGGDAIHHHVPAVAEHGGERESLLDILAANEFVNSTLGEKLRAPLQTALAEALHIIGQQFVELESHFSQVHPSLLAFESVPRAVASVTP